MIRQTRCLVLVCDGCQTTLGHPDTESEIHYDTAAQARTDATEDLHWLVSGERDLCPACTCAQQGHDWPGWLAPPAGSRLAAYRCCQRCSAVEIQGEGVLGHG